MYHLDVFIDVTMKVIVKRSGDLERMEKAGIVC
jgi:hypothetical protein